MHFAFGIRSLSSSAKTAKNANLKKKQKPKVARCRSQQRSATSPPGGREEEEEEVNFHARITSLRPRAQFPTPAPDTRENGAHSTPPSTTTTAPRAAATLSSPNYRHYAWTADKHANCIRLKARRPAASSIPTPNSACRRSRVPRVGLPPQGLETSSQ